MMARKIIVNQTLVTTLLQTKVERIADECGVSAVFIECRLRKDRRWLNEFEIRGEAGKVDGFFVRIKDLEVH